MALFRLTHPPENAPCAGRTFRIVGAEIVLRAEDLSDVLVAYLADYRLNRKDRRQKTNRYREFMSLSGLVCQLTEACNKGHDVNLDAGDGRGYVSRHASKLVFEKQFVSANCLECAQEYPPDVCLIVGWELEEFYYVQGGSRLVCPADHSLFAGNEWSFQGTPRSPITDTMGM